MKLSVRNLNYIRGKDARLYEAIIDIRSGLERMARQVVANPSGQMPSPPQISSLTVAAANGVFSAQIYDNNPVLRGIEYFIEYSSTSNFQAGKFYVAHLGPSRDWQAFLGNVTMYFRAYSSYPTSEPSAPVYYGPPNNPTAVVGGGTITPPTRPAGAGSGTSPSDGSLGGSGYGRSTERGDVRLK